ncbi:hypothetical protein [Mesorhizobium sp.]|uniref:hypothetical protein n=1 Tax=Mesorhizobium sp. TaxID=1871066 RepID=UPI000FE3E0EE|nr:hypothetical protein [Mesorhizobium sp.]RWA66127.1 MAG: hypothetical protein EOQ28_28640 [Mesorhizobium sp.]RWB96001.1 MAG: hypothetical protein EOQ57_28145 [Mesorhizobium sp.]RWG78285.1 MAG: hypothetical protein EOQ69_26915 [Mesorhizobium sp.]RWG79667.1 MAG: hypothetical protein EOQ70_28115 [Mesorhizobium sp.]RWJ98934.1 MAG: hypothetical protein EOR42_25820 [Mesorhizobium sp.]
MPRYATIITADDGAEIVSAIGEFESCGLPRSTGCVEEVAPGVLIGMVRGGPVEAVAGFGFPRQGLPHSAIAAVTATLKAAAPAPKLPISAELGETEGGAVPPTLAIGTAASDQVDRTPPPKPARAKPRKKPARKAARARKVSSAGALAVANG